MKTILILLLSSLACLAQTPVEWNANAPADAVTGYKLHWGTASGVYNVTVDVGNVTVFVIPKLFPGTYFAAVTAYNTLGESAPSAEISFVQAPSIPEIPTGLRRHVVSSSKDGIRWREIATFDVPEDYYFKMEATP